MPIPMPLAEYAAQTGGWTPEEPPPGPDTCQTVGWVCEAGHYWTVCDHQVRNMPADVVSGERCPGCSAGWRDGAAASKERAVNVEATF